MTHSKAKKTTAVLLLAALLFTFALPAFFRKSQEETAPVEDAAEESGVLTAELTFESPGEYEGFDPETDYLARMGACCLTGDLEGGRQAAAERGQKIEAMGIPAQKIDFDDLYLLAKVITVEAESDWLPMEWKMMVGEVLLNRVASPEFPDTMAECVYQPRQYAAGSDPEFPKLLPNADAVEAAARLLSGERLLRDPSVVFQGNSPQGSGVHTRLYDETLGATYLCYSSYPELYT